MKPQDFMSVFQCHKQVKAAKITEVTESAVSFEHQGLKMECIEGHAWITKHKPEVGGYLVVYEDGYKSYSPAKAFEEGYSILR